MWGTHAQIHRQQREMPTFKCRNVWVVSFRIHLLPYRSVIDCPWKIHVNMNRIEFKWIIYPFHSTPLHFDLCFNYLQLIFHCWIRLVLFVLECVRDVDLFPFWLIHSHHPQFTAFHRSSSTYCSNCDQENAPTECNPVQLPIIYPAILLVPKRLADLVNPERNK